MQIILFYDIERNDRYLSRSIYLFETLNVILMIRKRPQRTGIVFMTCI